MQPLNHTQSFMAGLKRHIDWREANPDREPLSSPCCIELERVQDMQAEITEAQNTILANSAKSWVLTLPNAESVGAAQQRIRMTGSPIDGASSYHRGILKKNGRYYVAGGGWIFIYDEQLNKQGQWGINQSITTITATSNGYEGYLNAVDFAADGRGLVCMDLHHVVRVFSADGLTRLFDIGTWNTAGYVNTNCLYHPYSAIWTKDGNILVASYSGNDISTSGNYGHVSLYNGQTGAFIRTLFKGHNILRLADARVQNPSYLHQTEDKIYVSSYSGQQIGVLDAATLTLLSVITAPTEYSLLNLVMNPYGVYADKKSNTLVIAVYNTHHILGLSLDSYSFKWVLQSQGAASSLNPLDRKNPWGIAVMDNGDLLIGDNGYHRLTRLPVSGKLSVEYDLEFDSQNFRVDTTNMPVGTYKDYKLTLEVPADQLTNLPQILVPLVQK
ncbi:hypothetical protein [Thiolinea disciformis]|uniref:hypothetical protein n=1 Tax=Thiolinea disciformis TaxID=125614 RepID=UPI00036D6CE4|nr:hypothetical protein [Thiolinea disciformis]